MIGTRWRKVWRDLWAHKTRSALAVMSIGVGVVAIGVTGGARQSLARDLAVAYAAIAPASVTIQALGPFDSDLVSVARELPGVRDAEGRTSLMVRARSEGQDWRNLQLIAIEDYDSVRIDKVRPDTGEWPPPERKILVERSGVRLFGARTGDSLRVKLPGQRERFLPVAGTAHDMYALLYTLDGLPWAFVTPDTLRWLGGASGFTELRLLVDDPSDRETVERVANDMRDRIEASGQQVLLVSMPEPGKHPLDSTIQTMLLVLGVLGLLCLLLGALLVTNTISALLAEEMRAIGVMKAIGAQRRQLAAMYAGLVLLFGALALAVALPVSAIGARVFAGAMAGWLNFDLRSHEAPARIIAVQVLVAIVVPLLAAAYPIWVGTRITVREALGQYGLGKGRFGHGIVDRGLERVRGLSRPVLLSLRNTFRRKGRLALTLTTLTAGTMIIVSVLNVRSAALVTLDAILNLWQYDLFVELGHPRRSELLVQEALRVPGVAYAEPWGWGVAHWPEDDESGSSSFYGFVMPVVVFAPPADTRLLKPTLLAGRWLLPDDGNAIVVNTKVMADHPDLTLGDPLDLTVAGRDVAWTVVGVVRDVGLMPIVYANYDAYARATGESGRASTLAVTTTTDDEARQAEIARRLEEHLGRAGLQISMVSRASDERSEAIQIFDFVLVLLLAMALLVAVVGGLGLTGAMSLNVIERTREIGVMRAIGAVHHDLVRIFVTEGLLIGWLSWVLGVFAALPISKLMGDSVGRAMLDAPLPFTFDARGAAVWLGIVSLVAIGASLLPAWRAARLSVREALAYE